MEKSIETIWKNGFVDSHALIAPKLNNLYNQKSQDIVEKFKHMFKLNLWGLMILAMIMLPMSFALGMPYMGVPFFIIINLTVFVNYRLSQSLGDLDKSTNSYEYLRSFHEWLQKQIRINARLSRILYPMIFSSMLAGMWFLDFHGVPMGTKLTQKLLVSFPDLHLTYGVPTLFLAGLVLICAAMFALGGKIYTLDLNIVYGRLLRKLDEIMADMEELRKES
ncbi:hypothetical protein BFP72_01270 [Reichenbachiella sp. 5M10]|uniref:hypothetical protein n=1 Tax=Reichenbachiella sp. 5M10 TaxID=1889772 RepID=UPI000C160CD4|nr:hypothetical protein [Reichenbachiella sp. 5M10]PIB34153.1 hypothetical protein BFP72_01270 [Reichenbachiella sp. 5M10]